MTFFNQNLNKISPTLFPIIVLVFLFFSISAFSQSSENSVYFKNDYSGFYKGFTSQGKSKKLIKLYLLTYNHTLPEKLSEYKINNGKKVYFGGRFSTYPEKLFFLIEYYDNKKGKGKPIKSEFFEGHYYNIDEKIYSKFNRNELIFFKGKYYTDQDNSLIENKRFYLNSTKNKYRLYKLENNNFELVFPYYSNKKIQFSKQDDTNELATKLNSYVSMIAQKRSVYENNSRNRIHLGSQTFNNPYSPTTRNQTTQLYATIINSEISELNANFKYSVVSNLNVSSLYNELATDWNFTLNKEIYRFFKNRATALKEELIYFPNIKSIKLFSKLPRGLQQENKYFHSHNITIERTPQKQLKFKIKPTSENRDLAYSSSDIKSNQEKYTNKLLAEIRKQRIEEEKRKEQERLNNLKQVEQWAQNIKSKGFKIKNKKFWDKFPRNGMSLKKLYEGNFRKLNRMGFFRVVLDDYKWHMSDNCRELLPENKIYEKVEITNTEKKYSHTNYYGGFNMGSFEAVYEYDTTKEIYDLYYDPRFKKLYEDDKEIARSQVLSEYYSGDLKNAFKELFILRTDEEEFELFLSLLNCDKESMRYVGENLFRYLTNQKSLQAEQ